MRLGFIGIGLMGEPMTLRLLDRGHGLTVWNLTADRYACVEAAGARVAATPAAVAEASDIVMLCVLDGHAVENCVFGRGGLICAQGGARIVVDHSTVNPDLARDVAQGLAQRTGMQWVDAPVSGGPPAAREGALTIMAGGDADAFAAAEPVLRDLGAVVTRVGGVGAGQTAKILNQAIVGAGYVLMAEVLALAEASGIDAAKLPDCLAGGYADSRLLQAIYPQMQARAFNPPRGYARQLLKDVKNVAAFAQNLDLSLPLIGQAVAQYARYVAQGNEMAASASISRLYDPQVSDSEMDS